jgi:hypothetical protein
MTSQPMASRPSSLRSWPVPAALVALSAIPLIAGTLRLVQLAGGPQLMPADERFGGFPLPLVLHIVGAAAYAVVGAFQFVARFRRRHLTWHRRAGRILTVAGWVIRHPGRAKGQRRVRHTGSQSAIATTAGAQS